MLASLFFVASVICILLGPQVHPLAKVSQKVQITLSIASVTLGATLVWLLLTFLLGRVYCATVCPVGTFSDIFLRIRRRIPKLNKPFAYRPASRLSPYLLWVYLLCIILGISFMVWILEPWQIMRDMLAATKPSILDSTWGLTGVGVTAGIIVGILTALLIAISSILWGRAFCTRWCPVGTLLGLVQEYSLMHIEFNPDKCTSCGLCEERCRAQAIKITGRYIDSRRCVRCFDCVAECPEDALHYQLNRNTPLTPLMRKTKRTPS